MSGEERKHRGCLAEKQLSCQTGFTESYICIAALVGYRSERQRRTRRGRERTRGLIFPGRTNSTG